MVGSVVGLHRFLFIIQHGSRGIYQSHLSTIEILSLTLICDDLNLDRWLLAWIRWCIQLILVRGSRLRFKVSVIWLALGPGPASRC